MDVTLSGAVRGEIKGELARRGLTQQVIADAWKISQPSASAKLNGKVDMTGDDIDSAARALGWDPFEFIERAKRNAALPVAPEGEVA